MSSQSKETPIFLIDPGHGGKDPGGGSNIFYDPEGFYEKDVVLEISKYQHERFKQLGVSSALTRQSDVYLSPEDRTKIVRNSGAKYCLSNHINAAGNSSARGVETIHSLKGDGKLAKFIFEAIKAEGMPGRRVFIRSLETDSKTDYYFMHRLTGNVTTIIIEYGFATNVEDAKLIVLNWKKYAEAVVRACCAFIDHPYKPPVTIVVPSKEPLPDIQRRIGVVMDGKQIAEGFLIGNVTYVPAGLIGGLNGLKITGNGDHIVIKK